MVVSRSEEPLGAVSRFTNDAVDAHAIVADKGSNSSSELQRQIQTLQRSNATLLAELERVCEEVQHTTGAKHDFLAAMSRQVRTSLNAMTGYTEQLLLLLGMRGDFTPEQQADIERITQSQQHLLAFINSLMLFASEQGRLEPE